MDIEETELPENKDPEFFGAVSQTFFGILKIYGWSILFTVIAILFLYNKLKPWLARRSQQQEDDTYKKMDAGVIQDRLEAMERARLKMQAQHDAEAKRFAERQKQKEDEKKKQRLKDMERLKEGKGSTNTRKAPEDLPRAATTAKAKTKPATKSLKPSYNPLMGSSSDSCYRPSWRGGRSGGG